MLMEQMSLPSDDFQSQSKLCVGQCLGASSQPIVIKVMISWEPITGEVKGCSLVALESAEQPAQFAVSPHQLSLALARSLRQLALQQTLYLS